MSIAEQRAVGLISAWSLAFLQKENLLFPSLSGLYLS